MEHLKVCTGTEFEKRGLGMEGFMRKVGREGSFNQERKQAMVGPGPGSGA